MHTENTPSINTLLIYNRNMENQLKDKETQLIQFFQAQGKVAVAFSGGVDSALLLALAHEVLGKNVLALTACFTCNPKREQDAARTFCEEQGVRQLELNFNEFAVPGFADNPANRCYLCKHALLSLLKSEARSQGYATLVEGSNLDDENDYRPGFVAVEELEVLSPLKTAGFTKADIRTLARERDLSVWDKPSCACLATRIPSNTTFTPELIARIDKAEEHVLASGAQQVRVRVPQAGLARIETDIESIPLLKETSVWDTVDQALKDLGFSQVELDPKGYRTGSMNQ